MKKYIVSILLASMFFVGAFFVASKTFASEMSIRDFVNLLINIGVIPSERIPAVNAWLVSQIEPVACTMDAMMCPDGSYVGRSAPDCRFICPAIDPANIKIGQSVTIQGIKITPLEIVSDNRCPAGAVCITAGTVTLKTRLESGSLSEEINLTQFNSVVFANKEIKINNAIPLREQRDILPSEYSFEFSVKSTSTTPQCTVDADCPQLISAGANSMFPTNRCINNKCVLEQIN